MNKKSYEVPHLINRWSLKCATITVSFYARTFQLKITEFRVALMHRFTRSMPLWLVSPAESLIWALAGQAESDAFFNATWL